MSDRIDRNTICNVKLRAEQWEIILAALGKQPYEAVAPIIQMIIPQIMNSHSDEQEINKEIQ